jgi:kumamolisin
MHILAIFGSLPASSTNTLWWLLGTSVLMKKTSFSNGCAKEPPQPDVAAVADNLAVYYDGGWGAVGGTSAAAPIWAAGQALVNEDTIQQKGTFAYGPRLYYKVADANGGSTAYYDVTYGNNLYYTATVGWDYTTGLGIPDLANFDKAVNNMLATANAS